MCHHILHGGERELVSIWWIHTLFMINVKVESLSPRQILLVCHWVTGKFGKWWVNYHNAYCFSLKFCSFWPSRLLRLYVKANVPFLWPLTFLWPLKTLESQIFQNFKENIGQKWVNDIQEKKQRMLSQSAFTCSKLTIETLEQGVKYVKS